VNERREVLLVVHPDREATRDAAQKVAAKFADAGIGLRVTEEEVRDLIEQDVIAVHVGRAARPPR
jgi:NAD+ kinase